MRTVRLLLVGAAAGALAVGTAAPASAATSFVWNMDEPAGARTMVGSPGPSGTIGTLVKTGVATDTGRGYSFPGGNPLPPQPMPGKIVTVPASAVPSPGTAAYSLSVRYRTGNTSNGNMVQKGETGANGGMVKIELHAGVINCTWFDKTWTRVNPPASSHLNLSQQAPKNLWTTVTCARMRANTATGWKTTLTVTVGGQVTTTFQNRAVGAITNTWPLAIGGKPQCSTQPVVECDYYSGLFDYVKLASG